MELRRQQHDGRVISIFEIIWRLVLEYPFESPMALFPQSPAFSPFAMVLGESGGGGDWNSGAVGEMGGLVTKVGKPRRQKLKNCLCPNCAVSRDTGQLGPPQVGQRTPN